MGQNLTIKSSCWEYSRYCVLALLRGERIWGGLYIEKSLLQSTLQIVALLTSMSCVMCSTGVAHKAFENDVDALSQ